MAVDAADNAANVRSTLDGTSISTFVLCMLIVPLKIVCRISVGRVSLGWDDWCAIISLLLANALFYTQLVGIRPMLGHNIWEYELSELIQFLKYVYALQIVYTVSIGTIKASLLCFYWRLFSVRSRVPLLVASGLVVSWVIITSLLLGLGCMPVEGQWDLTIPYDHVRCMDRKSVYVGASSGNVVMDIMVLVLPIPYVWNLHVRLGQRLVVMGIFLLGIFVTIVSIVRLSIFATLDLSDVNVTSTLSEVFIWSGIEINVGLICACLPSLRPAIQWLGLGKIFGSSGGQCSGSGGWVAPFPSYRSDEIDRAQQSSRKRGFLSTLALQLNDEEDSFQMIGTHNNVHGKTDTTVHVMRTSLETERYLHDRDTTAVPVIEVQRQFDISTDVR